MAQLAFSTLMAAAATPAAARAEPIASDPQPLRVALGLGVLGIATAGVVAPFGDDEPVNVAIGAGSVAAEVSF